MEIIERTDARLVIEDSSWRTAVALVGAAVVAGFFVSRQAKHFWQAGVGPAFLLLMAWIAKFRAVTFFDREHSVVRHERRRIGRRKVKERSFQDIIEIGLRLPPLSRHHGGWLIQVTLHDGDAFWLSSRPSRQREALQAIVEELRRFVGLTGRTTRTEQIRAMVRSGDTLGAVKLLRIEEGLSLSEAKRRIEEITALPTRES